MEGLALLLFVLADADKKMKRHALADELTRYLTCVFPLLLYASAHHFFHSTHTKVDEEQGTAHVCCYYDEVARHSLLYSNNRIGESSPSSIYILLYIYIYCCY